MPYVEREPVVNDPDSGSATGFAAIKYTAIIIIVVAIIAFLVWAIGRFT
jgi:hypothetical protein